ncbi:hypothetical protein MMC13_000411 [Lambiella insularis]|nr:hypothetical protein [Lambiella insularis]
MAHSPSSDRRAQLIREMSRDLGRTRPSSRSSQGSNGKAEYTTSDFDPENEALMSTQQLESTTQRLPELRASAQKYSRYNQPEPDFAINTSAIGRAFPDFTQGATSSDDDSMSIEIGRGVPRAESGKNEKLGRSSSKIGENSMDFSPAMIGNYQVMSTPPRRPSTTSKPATNTANDSLRRNAQVRRASAVQQETKKASQATAKATDYGSGGSRQGSAEHRRTLGSMHARVADEDAASDISDDRPQTLTLTARNTRFGNGRGVQAPILNNLPSKYTSAQGLVDALSQETVAKNRKAKAPIINGTLSSVNACTQQSFLLPDIPNVSELVSGVFEDGTPVFSRHGKPRSSRFASGVHSQPRKDYANVAGIPVPDEEQAIFVSLRLLQDKVAELENGKAEAEATMQELQDKNLILEREKTESKRFRRADSALGTTDGSDGSDDAGRGPRKWIIEKTRRESTIRTLQEQASAALHKNSVSGITIKNLTKERDSAVSQLGVAYFTTEQLKAENLTLKDENARLDSDLAKLRASLRNQNSESTRIKDVSRKKSDQQLKTAQAAPRLSHGNNHGRSHNGHSLKTGVGEGSSAQVPIDNENRRLQGSELKVNKKLVKSSDPHKVSGERKQRKTRVVVDEYSESEASDASVDGPNFEADQTNTHSETLPQRNEIPETTDGDAGDITFLSFLEASHYLSLVDVSNGN